MNQVRTETLPRCACVVTLLFFVLLGEVWAKTNYFNPSQPELRFSRLGLAEGLSHADVRRTVQDHQGFMWFGTWLDGLNRYDGYTFKVYRHDSKDGRSLAFDNVSVLHEDRQHSLWVGTYGGGLDRYDRETDTFIHYRHRPGDTNTLPEDTIRAVCEDENGRIWVGTGVGVSLFVRTNGTFTTYRLDQSNAVVRAICLDRRTGFLWIGKVDGVRVFDPLTGRFFHLNHIPDDPSSLSDNKVTHIYQDKKGDMWVCTDHGLNRWNPETKGFTRYRPDPGDSASMGDDFVSAVLEDRSGRFWVGTANGLDLFDRSSGTFAHYRNDPNDPASLSANYVNVGGIYEDDTGALWVSTQGGGVNRLDGQAPNFVTFRNNPDDANSLSQNTVTALYGDLEGKLWIGTVAGLDCLSGHNFVRYAHNPADPNTITRGSVWAITEGPNHQLWIGVNGGGVCRFDGTNFIRYRHDPANPDSLGGDFMYGLHADRSGGLWISVHSGGLDYFDGQRFTHFKPDPNDPDSLPELYVGSLVMDQNNCVWMGSAAMGLIQFDSLSHKATAHLLDPERPHSKVGNWVRDINSDGKNIWVATMAGLSKLDVQHHTFRNYDVEDGLQSQHFCERSRARMQDGQMCFGGVNGFNLFDPDRLLDNPVPPPVVLTEFQLFNKPVTIGKDSPLQKAIHIADRITLRYDQEVFRLRFAALSYVSPKKNRYAYRLEGFDADWRYTGANDRSATYTKLNPGNYVFHVKAANNDGVWNEQGASIAIAILPPWWQTWWFRVVAAVTLLMLAYVGYAARIQGIKRRNRWLEREVAERTAALEVANKELEAFSYSVSHDLHAPLRSIDGFSQALLEDYADRLDAEGREDLQTIRNATQRMGILIDDMLRLSRINRGEMRRTQVNLSAIVEEIAGDLRKSDPARSVEFVIAPDCAVNGDASLLRIALENILSNAWKYTGKKANARIEFGFTDGTDGRVFFIRDNGCGFDMKQAHKLFNAFQRLHDASEFPGTGVGLASVQRVIHRHGGRVWIEGEVDRGTVIYFSMPERKCDNPNQE